jgi:hypothetical protein
LFLVLLRSGVGTNLRNSHQKLILHFYLRNERRILAAAAWTKNNELALRSRGVISWSYLGGVNRAAMREMEDITRKSSRVL